LEKKNLSFPRKWESSLFNMLQNLWIPVFTGMTTFARASKGKISITVDKGLVKNVSDIYYLTKDQISGLDRMADKSAGNIIDAIELSKGRELSRVIGTQGKGNRYNSD